jgi:hypothetical protein
MPSIPIDILLLILEHVDKADLLTICLLNKICCSCLQDILYRDILISKSPHVPVLQTLTDSTHLAKRVRSLKMHHICKEQELFRVFLNLINLRHLSLSGHTVPTVDDALPKLGVTCLPNLTRVTAPYYWLSQLIPNRPVKEVTSLGYSHDPVDLSFFTLSTSPIQKIVINASGLYPKSGQYLASIFPSVTYLLIDTSIPFAPNPIVCEPPFLLITVIPDWIAIDSR